MNLKTYEHVNIAQTTKIDTHKLKYYTVLSTNPCRVQENKCMANCRGFDNSEYKIIH